MTIRWLGGCGLEVRFVSQGEDSGVCILEDSPWDSVLVQVAGVLSLCRVENLWGRRTGLSAGKRVSFCDCFRLSPYLETGELPECVGCTLVHTDHGKPVLTENHSCGCSACTCRVFVLGRVFESHYRRL